MAQSDLNKRKELLAEFVYYLIDSLLIPLLFSNFHITESATSKHTLLYLCLDAWHAVTAPTITRLRRTTYAPLARTAARDLLAGRKLGYSHVRLLPKSGGALRPIANLRRRPVVVTPQGRRALGRSINSVLTPAFEALRCAAAARPGALGAALQARGGLAAALAAFRERLVEDGRWRRGATLFFAKADVQACFDTLPQDQVVRLVDRLLLGAEDGDDDAAPTGGVPDYAISSTAVVHPPAAPGAGGPPRPRVRLRASARPLGEGAASAVGGGGGARGGGVVVAPLRTARYGAAGLARTLRQHVQGNVVRLAGRLCAQRRGIAQGGVASGLLATLAYGHGLEAAGAPLGELCRRRDVCVVRVVDDFLVVGVERAPVEGFLRTIVKGVPALGISVKKEKMAANFPVAVDGAQVHRAEDGAGRFPFCGVHVDTRSLEVLKSSRDVDERGVADGLTVEMGARPGFAFQQKMVNALRLQLSPSLLDHALLSPRAVLENLHHAMRCAGLRFAEYVRAMGRAGGAPRRSLLVRTLAALLRVAEARAARKAAVAAAAAAAGPRRAMARWTACAALAAELAGGGRGPEVGAARAWLAAARDREWRACTMGQRRVLGEVAKRARSQ